MPIFMDRHDVQGVTAEEVATVHQEDLKIQDKYNCRTLTYWFDEERGTAFCLVEAPDREAVKNMHDDAHGLVPNRIIEVDSQLVETFLGRIEDPEPAYNASQTGIPVFRDPAFRAIMVTGLKDAALLLSEMGMQRGREFVRICNQLIHTSIRQHNGRAAESAFGRFVLTFPAVSNAVDCAVDIQNRLEEYQQKNAGIQIRAGTGVHAGEPVTGDETFFGDVIRFAKRLCYISADGEIKVSSTVKEQYQKEKYSALPEQGLTQLTSAEEEFLDRLMDTTEEIWRRDGFTVSDFCRRIGVSKSQLYRKMTGLTGLSPSEFMKEFRLTNAIKQMEKHPDNIARVALECGFTNPSYFSKCFKQKFGLLPSEYISRIN